MMDIGGTYGNVFITFIILFLHLHLTSGECSSGGKLYMNHTLWLPNDCTICSCHDPVVVCDQVRCTMPNCDFAKGEYLQIPADDCCPECVRQLLPCEHEGQTVPHNHAWTTDHCTTCVCNNAEVLCEPITCPVLRCKPWQIRQSLEGQCCPQCVSTGRSCSYDGALYSDGAEWSAIECSRCVCRDGQTSCFPRQCPSTVCAQSQTLEVPENSCCPECIGQPCRENNTMYKDGQQWQKNPCQFCMCKEGHVICRSKECLPLTCAKTEMKILRPGHCCPECLPNEEVCHEETPVRYSGDIWNTSSCEYCMCHEGHVQCHVATCPNLKCKQTEEPVVLPGQCCPMCQEIQQCNYRGQVYMAGESWHDDPCTFCSCDHGETVCYQANCPVCPAGTVAKTQPGECCGQCQKIECAEPCATCLIGNQQYCTKCRLPNLYLDKGRCVAKCSEGKYPARDFTCQDCHGSCATCVDGTPHHCVTCTPGLLWRDGQCVPRCDRNFFQQRHLCTACHSSCSFCLGSGESECLSCSNPAQVLQNGHCVDTCLSNYYLRNRECQECPATCQTCSIDGSSCTSCYPGMVLYGYQCLSKCPHGFYASNDTCQRCHPSCRTCDGPEETECTSCVSNTFMSRNGLCRASCPQGQYLKTGGQCAACGYECSRCIAAYNGRDSVCIQCNDPSAVAFEDACLRKCPVGRYIENGMCKMCGGGCLQCESPKLCQKCGPGLFLSGHQCVRLCEHLQFTDWANQRCIDCPSQCVECDSLACTRCNSRTYLKDKSCVEACGHGFYSNDGTRFCEENQHPPTLHILSHLQTEVGGAITVPHDLFHVSDTDTANEDVSLVLTQPPNNGWLVMALKGRDTTLQQNNSFTMNDLKSGKIRYIHNANTARSIEVKFKASDRQLESPESSLFIQAVTKFPPRLSKKNNIFVERGNTVQIDIDVFDLVAITNHSNYKIIVLRGPLHGKIIEEPRGNSVSVFNLEKLRSGVIGYSSKEKGKEDRDLFILQVSDGFHILNSILHVVIREMDSELPQITNNRIGFVQKGQIMQITSDLLQAEVTAKQASDDLIFTLVPSMNNPNFGEIIMMVPEPKEGPGRGWESLGDGYMAAKMFRFMQRDIDEGRIWYRHLNSNTVSTDTMTFEVADTGNPPNILLDQSFQIQVLDEQIPTTPVSDGVRLALTVMENQVVPIRSVNLAFSDRFIPPENIIYTVIRPLKANEGMLEHISAPFQHIMSFTQADINNNRILYRPPENDIGPEERDFIFVFTVRGKGSSEIPKQHRFSIRVLPVNNTPPRFTSPINQIDVTQGGNTPLRRSLVSVNDPDTAPQDILFTLYQAPAFGRIEKLFDGGRVYVRQGESFYYSELLANVFQYRHTGNGYDLQDTFTVQVSDGVHVIRKQINVTISPVDESAPSMLTTATCRMVVNEGDIVEIKREDLGFEDSEDDDSRLKITVTTGPVHGNLMLGQDRILQTGSVFRQTDINNGIIRYHSNKEIGAQPIIEVLVFDVWDTSNHILPNQILTIVIQPVDNQPPVVIVSKGLMVEEGREVILSEENVRASDPDTPLSGLKIVLHSFPVFGQIVSKKTGASVPVREFLIQDMLHQFISYHQRDHLKKEPIEDMFLFVVTDDINESMVHGLNITIKPINDEIPEFVVEQLHVFENVPHVLTNTSLYALDLDNPPHDLYFSLDKTPPNGILGKRNSALDSLSSAVSLAEGGVFTYQDVIDGLLVYRNQAGQYEGDSFTLTLTDGLHSETKVIDIVIGLMDDETPRLSINRGLRVHSGSITAIKSDDLQATDIDSEDAELRFIMKKDPSSGHLRIYSTNKDLQILSSKGPVKSFYQRDITNGYVEYEHTAGDVTGVIEFKFDVMDPNGNSLIDNSFYITVLVDISPPKMLNNRELVVQEGSIAVLTTDFLSFTDIDSLPGALRYFLVTAPQLGHLALITNQGVPISEFSESDLAANVVCYVHDSSKEMYTDIFTFAITDGTNEARHRFSIRIEPVDDEIPVVVNNGLVVQEGLRKIISEFDLKAVDKDTQESQLLFQITQPPVYGSIQLYDGKDYVTTNHFTMLDIYNGFVSYIHDGSDTREDNFSFILTDGATQKFLMQQDDHRESTVTPQDTPEEFKISIQPIDDGSPFLTINNGIQRLELSPTRAFCKITPRELQASDVDTEITDLVFVVTVLPRHGFLELTTNPNVPVSTFTQENINQGQLQYVLTSSHIRKMEDSFTFNLMDRKPNQIVNNVFHIQWSLLGFEQDKLNVTETAGVVQIPVHRYGNQKQYSVVSCVTHPGSATSDVPSGSQTLPGRQDYAKHSAQVQFDEWQDNKYCNIVINDDSKFEGPEVFYVELVDPVFSLIDPSKSRIEITITDFEDQPVIQFQQAVYHVNESKENYVETILTRTGDLEEHAFVICYTTPQTAKGSSFLQLESGSDYISRGRTNHFKVVFPPGVSTAACDVKIIDDSKFETSEQFEVGIMSPSYGTILGPLSKATVIIDGPNDESSIYFSLPTYHFDEDAGDVDLEIHRIGSDLSHNSVVWCATRMSNPPSALPGEDYVASSSQVRFSPGQTSEVCKLTILEDKLDPRIEGNETFSVFLSSPTESVLGSPHLATVVIHDNHLDEPSMAFMRDNVTVRETNRTVEVPIHRYGDLSYPTSVICYTRQGTAKVTDDFQERIMGNASRIFFQGGEKVKPCIVEIVDDTLKEEEEYLYIHLANPDGGHIEAKLGHITSTRITITNPEDEPTITIEQPAYTVTEPSSSTETITLPIKILRTGDRRLSSSVRCSTRDGSAISGVDYHPNSQILTFEPGEREKHVNISILHNSDIEWHESFSIMLGPGQPQGAILGPVSRAIITILDEEVSGGLVMPAPPVVVSLMNYDDVESGMNADPVPGYPLVCVSACDIRYPTYSITHSMCQKIGINQTNVLYRWEMAMPIDPNTGAKMPFVLVTDSTLFTDVDKKVLDSIYFRRSFRVRCITQPLNKNGNPGIPIRSQEVVINRKGGVCKSPVYQDLTNSYGAQSFVAKLKYKGPEDNQHPNTIHISIQIPHQDGHLPLISTYPLNNLKYLLAEPAYRQQHLCSNLITPEEREGIVSTGFLRDSTASDHPGYNFPYQHDKGLRSNKTIALYRHLNMKSCMWTFEAWYHIADLVDVCGGNIMSDFQVKGVGQTYLTLTVPLYVYYVYPMAPTGWGSLQHHSDMELSFYYDNILWNSGIETQGSIAGDLQVLKVLVDRDGKLSIDFKTQAKFRGQYVIQHPTLPNTVSQVHPPEGMALTFNLTLLWSQQRYENPHQLWRATSNFNLKDYSGIYQIALVPCVVSPSQLFTYTEEVIPCTAKAPQHFQVPIAFQQSNRPVPLVYSLNTEFQLTSRIDLFVANPLDPQSYNIKSDDTSFAPGQKIYGRVLWDPRQDLKQAYALNIEKVFLCTGRNGYIPTYDPRGEVYGEGPQFGCLQPNKNLLHRFLILDRGDSDAIQRQFHGIPFEAHFARDMASLADVSDMPGVDGFILSVDPLYKVTSGSQWYLQVVFNVAKGDNSSPSYRNKRSLRPERNTSKTAPTSGTNMISVFLQQSKNKLQEYKEPQKSITKIVLPVIFILIFIFIVFIIFYRRRKRKAKPLERNIDESSIDNIEVDFRESVICRQTKQKRLSQSRFSINITEVKDSTVTLDDSGGACKVKIKNSPSRTLVTIAGAGTEV